MSIKCLNNICEYNQLEDNPTDNAEYKSPLITNDQKIIDIKNITNLQITNNRRKKQLI
jgi:hypothetical protein